jgi:hypothetical protein
MNDNTKEPAKFLRLLQESSEAEFTRYTDDLLTYLYRIDDQIKRAKEKGYSVPASLVSNLREVLYQLESNPDEILKNNESKNALIQILKMLSKS